MAQAVQGWPWLAAGTGQIIPELPLSCGLAGTRAEVAPVAILGGPAMPGMVLLGARLGS